MYIVWGKKDENKKNLTRGPNSPKIAGYAGQSGGSDPYFHL